MATDSDGDGYVWFENVQVFTQDMRLLCSVAGSVVPLPVVILHPDCALTTPGDVGRFGVPKWWAVQRRLCN
jgi:hypothetical protein